MFNLSLIYYGRRFGDTNVQRAIRHANEGYLANLRTEVTQVLDTTLDTR